MSSNWGQSAGQMGQGIAQMMLRAANVPSQQQTQNQFQQQQLGQGQQRIDLERQSLQQQLQMQTLMQQFQQQKLESLNQYRQQEDAYRQRLGDAATQNAGIRQQLEEANAWKKDYMPMPGAQGYLQRTQGGPVAPLPPGAQGPTVPGNQLPSSVGFHEYPKTFAPANPNVSDRNNLEWSKLWAALAGSTNPALQGLSGQVSNRVFNAQAPQGQAPAQGLPPGPAQVQAQRVLNYNPATGGLE